MTNIRILLADELCMFRDGLQAALERNRGITVVGEAGDAGQLVHLAKTVPCDVILSGALGGHVVEAIREIRASQPEIRVIALLSDDDTDLISALVEAGIRGCLMKRDRVADLVRALRLVVEGGAAFDPCVTAQLVCRYRQLASDLRATETALAERERDLLRCLAAGMSNEEIAARLSLSKQTIKNSLTALYSKLGVSNRTQAVVVGMTRFRADLP